MRKIDSDQILGLPLNVMVGLAMAMSALSGGFGAAMQVPEPGRYAAMAGAMLAAVAGLLMIRGSGGYSKLMDSMRTHPLPWVFIAFCFLVAMGLVLGFMRVAEQIAG